MVNSTKDSRDNFSKMYDSIDWSRKGKQTSIQRKAARLYNKLDVSENSEVLGEIRDIAGKRGYSLLRRIKEIEERVTPIYDGLTDSGKSYVQGEINILRRKVLKNTKRVADSAIVLYNLRRLKGNLGTSYALSSDESSAPTSSKGLEDKVWGVENVAPIKVDARPRRAGWRKYLAAAAEIVVATAAAAAVTFAVKYLVNKPLNAEVIKTPEPQRKIFIDESAKTSSDPVDIQIAALGQVEKDMQSVAAKYLPKPNSTIAPIAEPNLPSDGNSLESKIATVEPNLPAANPPIENSNLAEKVQDNNTPTGIIISGPRVVVEPAKPNIEELVNFPNKYLRQDANESDTGLILPDNARIEVVQNRLIMPDSHGQMVGQMGHPFRADPKLGEYSSYLKEKARIQFAYGETGSGILTKVGETVSQVGDILRVFTYRPAAALVGAGMRSTEELRLGERTLGLLGIQNPYDEAVKKNTKDAWKTGAQGGIEIANFVWRNTFGPNHLEEYAKVIEGLSSGDYDFSYEGDPFVKDDGPAGFWWRRFAEYQAYLLLQGISGGGNGGGGNGVSDGGGDTGGNPGGNPFGGGGTGSGTGGIIVVP
jgi:hypothetical protein